MWAGGHLWAEAEPSPELPARFLGRRSDAKAGEVLVGAQERGQDVVSDYLARRRRAAGEEAHDLGIAVEVDQVVHVGLAEPAHHQALGCQEDLHSSLLLLESLQI